MSEMGFQEKVLETFLFLKRNHPHLHGALLDWLHERMKVHSAVCHTMSPKEPALPRAQGAYQELDALIKMVELPSELLEEYRKMRGRNTFQGVV